VGQASLLAKLRYRLLTGKDACATGSKLDKDVARLNCYVLLRMLASVRNGIKANLLERF